METGAVNSAANIKVQNAEDNARKAEPHVNLEQKPDTVTLSGKNTDLEKPGFLKSFGTGLLTCLKSIVPFYGRYMIGKEYLEQENIKKDIKDIKEGKETETKKPGALKSWLVGVGLSTAYSIPFLGSYLVGKHVAEQDNAIKELKGEETKDVGFFKALGTGILTKLGFAFPVLGTYLLGNEIAEQDKLQKAVDELKQEA